MALTLGTWFCLGAAGLRAEPIPPEWLQRQHDSCVRSCIAAGSQFSRCEQICSCASQEAAATMTREEYSALSNAVTTGQPIPTDLNEKLMTIDDRCKEE